MGDFVGLVALVTGGGSGIGRSTGAVRGSPCSATGTVLAVDGGTDAPRPRPRA